MASLSKHYEAAAYSAKETALFLVDFHVFLVNMIEPSKTREEILSKVRILLKTAREGGATIIHGQIDFTTDPHRTSKFVQPWDQQYRPMIENSPGSIQIWEELVHTDDVGEELVVAKLPGCISNFKSNGVLNILREQKIQSVIVCGLISSGAVLSTARDIADYGFVTTVAQDCCWDWNAQAHKAVMETILQVNAHVMSAQDCLSLLRDQEGTHLTATKVGKAA